MELKVWVEGIQRTVCGVTEKTTCQDVVYALAHATGKTGRFTLIERWRNNERLLAPQEHPLKVLNKWGEYSQDVQFILQRSALDGAKNPAAPSGAVKSGPMSPQMQRNYPAGIRPPAVSGGGLLAKAPAGIVEPPAVWKPPPPGYPPPQPRKGGFNNNPTAEGARLSPDSGRGSDKTGSDTSNSYTDNKDNMKNNNSKAKIPQTSHPYPMMNGGSGSYNYNNNVHRSVSASHMLWRLPPPGASGLPPPPHDSESPYGFTKQTSMPVLQKQHPPAYKPPPNPVPTSSSSPADPPRYREPPPAPGIRYRTPSSPKTTVRPPHYSPPPTHKTHLSRHPSKSSLVAASGVGAAVRPPYLRGKAISSNDPPTDMTELLNLVTAQQSTLQAQQADMRQIEAEEAGFSTHGESGVDGLSPGSQMDLVLSEVRRLEELSLRNDDELKFLNSERAQMENDADGNIRNEIMQLKQRLAGTDVELQRTNTTLRRLGDEMRNMSLEKTRQREQELVQEVDRLQNEIKSLQKSSEDSANISQQLSKDVKEVESQIRQRKSEVEQLIKEMREANMESLAISPPEESKQFLDGPPKPGTSRKMMGSPRQLENAVPTSRNPHGVWV